MSEIDESQDWPLRDYSSRLRPPARTDETSFAEPELPAPTSEPEILYDEDEAAEAALPEPKVEPQPQPQPQPEPEPVLEPAPLRAPEPEPIQATVLEEAPAELVEHAAGDFRVPDGYQVLEGAPDGTRRAVAIVVSRFNGEITNKLLASALKALDDAGVARDAVLVVPVPGAFELPLTAMALAKTRRYSCIVALGAVIRGETPHFEYVSSEAASGLQLAGIETGVPVSFGLLTCDTAEQGEARVERGAWAAQTALEMADVFAQLRATSR